MTTTELPNLYGEIMSYIADQVRKYNGQYVYCIEEGGSAHFGRLEGNKLVDVQFTSRAGSWINSGERYIEGDRLRRTGESCEYKLVAVLPVTKADPPKRRVTLKAQCRWGWRDQWWSTRGQTAEARALSPAGIIAIGGFDAEVAVRNEWSEYEYEIVDEKLFAQYVHDGVVWAEFQEPDRDVIIRLAGEIAA